jgi:hypothetical protein
MPSLRNCNCLPAAVYLAAAVISIACRARPEVPAHAQAFPQLEFVGAWGTPGDGPGQLSRPVGIAADSVGSIYIADAGSKLVHKFSAGGSPLLSFGDGRIREPADIAVDSGGAIHLADAGRHSILVFAPDGRYGGEFRGDPGTRLRNPLAVKSDFEGNLYVLHEKGTTLAKLNSRGQTVWNIPILEQQAADSNLPQDMAVSEDGKIFVLTVGPAPMESFPGPAVEGNAILLIRSPYLVGLAIFNGMEVFGSPAGWFIIRPDGTRTVLPVHGAMGTGIPLHTNPALRLAATSRGELLAIDRASPRVWRYRLKLKDVP